MKNISPPASKTLRTTQDLLDAGYISETQKNAIEDVAQIYATAIPPAFQKIITHPDDPIGRQVIPNTAETIKQTYENTDPIGDDALSPLKGIVHRYADRALLKPLLICPLYCRFCFRREHVGPEGGVLTDEELEKAFHWIETHSQIQEIILTGGDPFMLSPRRMKKIITRLSTIPHITTIRIHTRVPFAAPEKITNSFLESLETDRALWIVVHANHAKEFTQEAKDALKKLLQKGIPLLSQSVLLKNINDTIEALENLLRAFVQSRVKPYYLHHLDNAPGTAHFQVPIEEGQKLLQSLRGRVSGLAWPTYILDIPQGKGKVPIGPHYLLPPSEENEKSGEKRVRAPDGRIYKFQG